MAQDLGLDFAAGPSVSGLFGSDISAGANQTSSAIDLGAPTPLAIGIEAVIILAAGTPAGNKQAVISLQWSHDNSDFDDATNMDLGMIVAMETASTTYKKNRTIPVQARYLKIDVKNDHSSGPAITGSGSSITLYDVFGDQA